MTEKAVPRPNVLPPPSERATPLGWARRNLFSNWYNSLLTVVALALILAILLPASRWVFTQARWGVILVNLRLFITGTYPVDQLWRPWLALHMLAAISGLTWGVWVRGRRNVGIGILLVPIILAIFVASSLAARLHLTAFSVIALAAFGLGRLGGRTLTRTVIRAWILYFPLVLLIISGLTPNTGWFPVVPTNFWNGLLLTFLLTVSGIVFSFPLGVLLALGASLGLSNDFASNVIKAVGNYGEIYERNLGEGTPTFIPRGLNTLYTKGGLLYSPPFR